MATNQEVLESLAKLEKSSKLAIPLALISFLAIMAMIALSGIKLSERQREISEANAEITLKRNELQKLRVEAATLVAEAEARVRAADQQIEAAASSFSNQDRAVSLQSARQELAIADASLSKAKASVVQTNKLSTTGPRFGTLNLDIFYCESKASTAKPLAGRVGSLKDNSVGRWRVRSLSETVNASEGYRIYDNVIRFNPDEAKIAQNLAMDAKEKLNIEFRLQETSYPTPGYLSAFICSKGP